MNLTELVSKWAPIVAADGRWSTGEPAAPIKPTWREVMRVYVWAKGAGRILVSKGVCTQAELDAAIQIEIDALDALLTTRFPL